jgi:integrase
MWAKVRYVVEKHNADGSSRFYWDRRGHPTHRLLGTEAERIAEAERLNNAADAERAVEPDEPVFGTISWAVAEYRASPAWQKLAVSTRRVYEPFMISLDRIKGRQPVTTLTRSAVREVLKGVEAPGRKVHCAAVLKRVLDVARDHDLIQNNPAIQLGLAHSGKRGTIWSDRDIEHFLSHCTGTHGAAVALHLRLMENTAQRPGDCRVMQWQAYDGHRIELVQQKTRKLVWVPCPAPLLVVLDGARKQATGVAMVANPNGQCLGEGTLRSAFAAIRGRAGLQHLQARDLRRTAMVRLAEAGCTVPEIAAISGHSIDRTERILEVYLPRTRAMASAAIAKLDEWRK